MEIRLDKILKWHFKWVCALDDPTPDFGNASEVSCRAHLPNQLRLDAPTVQYAAICKDSFL